MCISRLGLIVTLTLVILAAPLAAVPVDPRAGRASENTPYVNPDGTAPGYPVNDGYAH